MACAYVSEYALRMNLCSYVPYNAIAFVHTSLYLSSRFVCDEPKWEIWNFVAHADKSERASRKSLLIPGYVSHGLNINPYICAILHIIPGVIFRAGTALGIFIGYDINQYARMCARMHVCGCLRVLIM